LFIAVAVEVTAASTIVVSKTSPACTSGDEYFTSISAAVDNAKEWDDIVVCPGTYKENIEVGKSVCICSYAGAADTVIEAKNIDDNIINITTNKVNISGFTIKNTEANGIYLDAAVGCNLSGNNIYSTQNGIRLFLSNRNQIYLNTGNLNNNSGISLEGSNDNLISNNIANSKQYNGIELNLSNIK
jgi:nitrous oxidase accessory protein